MNFIKISRLTAILICFCGLLAAQAPPLAVVDETLPPLDAGVEFHMLLHASGGVPLYVWSVEDSGHPAHTINKEFKAVVIASLLIEWLQPPKVRDNRIDGVVQLSNGSKDDFDLTVIIVAVADNGRATAIGYEHFPLKSGAASVQLPFGNTLPHGAYVIHADAIAEIPTRKAILRQRLQTPQPLQVVQGP